MKPGTGIAMAAGLWLLNSPASAAEATERLVAALLGPTPMVSDLRQLTDEIGGRPTGSEANLAAVEWGLERFQEAGIKAWKDPFEMSFRWLEISAAAKVMGDNISFAPRIAAMPYSTPTTNGGLEAPVIDGGRGGEDDFSRLGEAARGAFVLIETDELADLTGLFAEYSAAYAIEARAFAAGVAGVVYMGSRPRDVLYRHNASLGPENQHPMLVMERDAASRMFRLLRQGKALRLHLELDIDSGGAYESYNVIGEIEGSAEPEEFVILGAHLDSWGLGTGALDNGCNVAMLIDIARQMKRLGIVPRRTIRFALWNGEEQGFQGSWGYVRRYRDSLDRHVMASSFDIGSGSIRGFFTGGRPEVLRAVTRALEPVAGLGPFAHIDAPLVGTDNFDFMMEGIGNLVAAQESANYGPNYHARTDTFDRVDLEQIRINAAIASVVAIGFANMDVDWQRQSREEIEALIETTSLGKDMKTFGAWEAWESGERGRAATALSH